MDYRLVGLGGGNTGPLSWTKPDSPASETLRLENSGSTIFGWGPADKVPIVGGPSGLKTAMKIIVEAVHEKDASFYINRPSSYKAWLDGQMEKPITTARKSFEIDFITIVEGNVIHELPNANDAMAAVRSLCGGSKS